MNNKVCSIVWVGLKTGTKWISGDADRSSDLSSSDELQMLQNEFDRSHQDTVNWSSQKYVDEAVEFLNQNGYEVVYNDFDQNLDESMTEKEADKFVAKLRKSDSVEFKYEKVNDEIRKAHGTLKRSLIPQHGDVNKARRKHHVPDSVIIYWDLDKKMFRCFKKNLFIEVLDNEDDEN